MEQRNSHEEEAKMLAKELANGGRHQDEEEEELDQEQLTLNVKVTYDIWIQNELEATSHSVQWLKKSEADPENDLFNFEYFLVGTHFAEEQTELGNDKLQVIRVRVPKQPQKKTKFDFADLKEDFSRFQVVKEWKHEGEVNRARANPFNQDQYASLTTSGDVHIFDMKADKPTTILKGLVQDGFGLSWNYQKNGILIAASGKNICGWDLNKGNSSVLALIESPQGTVNDVKFSPLDPNLFISSSDDGFYKIWDLRTHNIVQSNKASENELTTACFNHVNQYVFATGGERSGMLNIWDMRIPQHYLNDLNYHQDQVMQLEWSPFKENLIMSSSQDKKVFIWDASKVGEEQARHDYADGPPELIFPHETHLQPVEDIFWSPYQEHSAVSVDTAATMQIWKMNPEFFEQEIDFWPKLDQIKDEELE